MVMAVKFSQVRLRRMPKLLRFGGDKFEADGGRDGDVFARGSELAGVDVNVERHDRIAPLIFDEHEIAGRIEREVARFFAAGGNDTLSGEAAFLGIDFENGDAIHAAIGDVKETAAGVNGDFGDVIARREFRRQGGESVDLFQVAGFCVKGKTGDGGGEFADDEKKFTV